MKTRIFLDTGIFVAFLNHRDQWHEAAKALFNSRRPQWFTSLLVISEAYSWFLHRMGEEAARCFRKLAHDLTDLKVLEISNRHHHAVVEMLEKFRGAKLSYVDASSLCFLSDHKIATVWSTDHHLGLTGASILPRC